MAKTCVIQRDSEGKVVGAITKNPNYKPINVVTELFGLVNATLPQLSTIEEVITDITSNIAKRLGTSVAEYQKNHKVIYTEQQPTSQEALALMNDVFMTNLSEEDKTFEVLNQPNQNLNKPFSTNPKLVKLGLDLTNTEHQWLAKYLTTTEEGKTVLNKANTIQEAEALLQEAFKIFGEEIDGTNKYYMTDISTEYVDRQIKKAEAESNSERKSMWEDVQRNPQKYIDETHAQQKVNLQSIYQYYKAAHEYPLGMKLMILNAITSREYTYDFEKDKISTPSKRDSSTMSMHFTPNSIFMNRVIQHGMSDKSIIHDYYYEASNFKGEKIDMADYKSNVHYTTPNGTWYKFTKDIDGDNERFHKMSALSAIYKGAWCTGSNQTTADDYLDRGDMYLFYSNQENNPTLQVHLHGEKEVGEIGGLLSGQGVREQDMQDLEEFKNTEKDIDFKTIEDYLKYSKVTAKWVKAGKDISVLSVDEKRIILDAQQYYKDNTTNLKEIRNQFTKEDYVVIFDVKEEDIHLGDLEISSQEEMNSIPRIIIGELNIIMTVAENIQFKSNSRFLKNVNVITASTQKVHTGDGTIFYKQFEVFSPTKELVIGNNVKIQGKFNLENSVGNITIENNCDINQISLHPDTIVKDFNIKNSNKIRKIGIYNSEINNININDNNIIDDIDLDETMVVSINFNNNNKVGLIAVYGDSIQENLSFNDYNIVQEIYNSRNKYKNIKFNDYNNIKNFNAPANSIKIGSQNTLPSYLTVDSKILIVGDNNKFSDLSINNGEDIKIGDFNNFNFLHIDTHTINKLSLSDTNKFSGAISIKTNSEQFNTAVSFSDEGKITTDLTHNGNIIGTYNTNIVLNQDSRASIIKTKDSSLTIFSKDSDITSIIHEKAHEYESQLTPEEITSLELWSGHKHGTVEFSEAFAKGAEKVIYGDHILNKEVDTIFQKLAKWFQELIQDAVDYFKDINELNPEVIEIYRKMMLKEGMIKENLSSIENQYYNNLKNILEQSGENTFNKTLTELEELVQKHCK